MNEPIRDGLIDPTDEAALARMWGAIDQRRAVSPRRRLVFVAGLAAVVASGAVGFVATRGPDGPAIGRPVEATFTLADGARVELAEDTRIVPVVRDSSEVGFVLEHGRVTFDVPPGLGRRWWVDAGRTTVEVVGTRFEVTRDGDRVEVAVTRGAVLVRSELLADRVRRLTAGERVVVRPESRAVVDDTATADVVGTEPARDGGVARVRDRRVEAASEPIDAGVRGAATSRGDAGAVDRVEVAADAGVAAAPEALLAEADRARRAGEDARAADLLQRFVVEHPGHAQASVAAFTLGRLALERLDAPARAADAFERCLEAGVPQALEEDAWARLVQSYARAGDRVAAQRAARRYLDRFPEGRRAAEVRDWVSR